MQFILCCMPLNFKNMIIDIKVQCEHNDCFESLILTGEGLKDMLKNDPEKLLSIIENIEKNFPKPLNGGKGKSNDDSFLMMAAASSSAF